MVEAIGMAAHALLFVGLALVGFAAARTLAANLFRRLIGLEPARGRVAGVWLLLPVLAGVGATVQVRGTYAVAVALGLGVGAAQVVPAPRPR